jgi:hypothetical protein
MSSSETFGKIMLLGPQSAQSVLVRNLVKRMHKKKIL